MLRPGVAWVGSCCAAPGLHPVLPAAPRAVTAARRPWRGSLITVTHDGSGRSGRDQRTGMSPILGRRSFPLASTLNRAVNGMACLTGPGPGPASLRILQAARHGGEEVPVRGVQVRQGPLEYHGRYRTGQAWLRNGLGRGQPRRQVRPSGPAPAHRTPQRPRLTGSRRPRRRPERPAR